MIAAKIPAIAPTVSIQSMRPLKADREGLRALPEGSLGREYLAFVEAEGISADGLVDASDISRQRNEAAELRNLGARDLILDGRRRSKRSAWFLEVSWHQWLERPVDDVRRDLGVDRLAHYRPVRTHEVNVSLVA